MSGDVRIHAPIAQAMYAGVNPVSTLPIPSKDEIIQAQDVEIRRLMGEAEKLRVTAATIANATVCLVYMLGEERGDSRQEIRIPRSLKQRLDGAQIKLRAEPDGEILISHTAQANDVVFDGRPD